ncbi:hypothetical protein QJS66_10810 [Kocuria rhizophila]|nr:hypothetical protein QJS66_10810 [Kocuria rhizophila]
MLIARCRPSRSRTPTAFWAVHPGLDQLRGPGRSRCDRLLRHGDDRDGTRRFAGPIILATMVALAVRMLARVDFSIAWSIDDPPLAGRCGCTSWVVAPAGPPSTGPRAGLTTTHRSAMSRGAIVAGNCWAFHQHAAVRTHRGLARGRPVQTGRHRDHLPADMVQTIPSTPLLVLASSALLILTVAVRPHGQLRGAHLRADRRASPRALNFQKAAILSAMIGLVILPWNLYNFTRGDRVLPGRTGCAARCTVGIIMVDYWLIRRSSVNVQLRGRPRRRVLLPPRCEPPRDGAFVRPPSPPSRSRCLPVFRRQ